MPRVNRQHVSQDGMAMERLKIAPTQVPEQDLTRQQFRCDEPLRCSEFPLCAPVRGWVAYFARYIRWTLHKSRCIASTSPPDFKGTVAALAHLESVSTLERQQEVEVEEFWKAALPLRPTGLGEHKPSTGDPSRT